MAKSKQEALDSEVPQPTNVYEAINAVMAEVGYVQKQKSAGLNYSYAGEAALIAAVRPHLVQYGLVIYPSGVRELKTETYTTSKGSVMNRTMGIFAFTFAHAPSNTSFSVEVLGEGADSGDKSANKAMTGALKYAWRQTFGIETGDDPDKYPSEDQERSNGTARMQVSHWSEREDFVRAFQTWCEREEIGDAELLECFGTLDLSQYPPSAKETKGVLEGFMADRTRGFTE